MYSIENQNWGKFKFMQLSTISSFDTLSFAVNIEIISVELVEDKDILSKTIFDPLQIDETLRT